MINTIHVHHCRQLEPMKITEKETFLPENYNKEFPDLKYWYMYYFVVMYNSTMYLISETITNEWNIMIYMYVSNYLCACSLDM